MPDAPEIQSLVEAAERAAAEGNHASAEAHLREAARLQEASLGSSHPDLANTLNNLGVVCEIAGKPDDAEHAFRRAWEIAAKSLPPDHPFVATSRKNLEDFCAARGKAVDTVPPAPATPPAPPAAPVASPAPTTAPAARRQDDASRPDTRRESRREAPGSVATRGGSFPGTGALVVAVLVVTVVVVAMWFRSCGQADEPQETPSAQAAPSSEGSRSAAPAQSPASPAAPPAEPESPGRGEAGKIVESPAPQPPSEPPAPRETRPGRASAAPSLEVADARLCQELSTSGREWQCVPPGNTVGPGRLFFYTRIKSPADTTIEHRWYHGNGLIQAVKLRIRANTGPGYRTYSRQTIGVERTGSWRVELRTEAGELLHEERFVVR